MGHNYSHVPEETLSNFAYVCLDVTQSVEEVGSFAFLHCATCVFNFEILLDVIQSVEEVILAKLNPFQSFLL